MTWGKLVAGVKVLVMDVAIVTYVFMVVGVILWTITLGWAAGRVVWEWVW